MPVSLSGLCPRHISASPWYRSPSRGWRCFRAPRGAWRGRPASHSASCCSRWAYGSWPAWAPRPQGACVRLRCGWRARSPSWRQRGRCGLSAPGEPPRYPLSGPPTPRAWAAAVRPPRCGPTRQTSRWHHRRTRASWDRAPWHPEWWRHPRPRGLWVTHGRYSSTTRHRRRATSAACHVRLRWRHPAGHRRPDIPCGMSYPRPSRGRASTPRGLRSATGVLRCRRRRPEAAHGCATHPR